MCFILNWCFAARFFILIKNVYFWCVGGCRAGVVKRRPPLSPQSFAAEQSPVDVELLESQHGIDGTLTNCLSVTGVLM